MSRLQIAFRLWYARPRKVRSYWRRRSCPPSLPRCLPAFLPFACEIEPQSSVPLASGREIHNCCRRTAPLPPLHLPTAFCATEFAPLSSLPRAHQIEPRSSAPLACFHSHLRRAATVLSTLDFIPNITATAKILWSVHMINIAIKAVRDSFALYQPKIYYAYLGMR